MRISYTNTFFDLLKFQVTNQFLSLGSQVFFVAASAFAAFVMSFSRSIMGSLAVGVGLFAAMWLVQAMATAFMLATRRAPTDDIGCVLEIQKEGLLEETPVNRSLHFWNPSMRVKSRAGLSAIYLSPQLALIVPWRAFSSKQQREGFLALLQERLSERSAA